MKDWTLYAKTEGSLDDDLPDSLLTPWSTVHFLAGAIADSWFDIRFWPWEALHLSYEIKDRLVHERTNDLTQHEYNSEINSAGDQMISGLGHYAGRWVGKRSFPLLLVTAATLAFVSSREDIG
jgi:hypothetical protein